MKCERCQGLMTLTEDSEPLGGSDLIELYCINCGARSETCFMNGKLFIPEGRTTRVKGGNTIISNDRNRSRPPNIY